mmetsp:Transcript_19089/g.61443  ORF Transcript_19089/g.61443 Transcript_19089/m.61443 type:complete len:131 (-) Transcript_19089:558-950(-)
MTLVPEAPRIRASPRDSRDHDHFPSSSFSAAVDVARRRRAARTRRLVLRLDLVFAHYQRLLEAHGGIAAEDALTYTTHGIRRGAATSMVKHQVPEHIVLDRAGVTSRDWIATYDEVDLDRRRDCSRALGL